MSALFANTTGGSAILRARCHHPAPRPDAYHTIKAVLQRHGHPMAATYVVERILDTPR